MTPVDRLQEVHTRLEKARTFIDTQPEHPNKALRELIEAVGWLSDEVFLVLKPQIIIGESKEPKTQEGRKAYLITVDEDGEETRSQIIDIGSSNVSSFSDIDNVVLIKTKTNPDGVHYMNFLELLEGTVSKARIEFEEEAQ